MRREQDRRHAAVAQSSGPMISVTIDSPSQDIGPHWDDLVRRASSNVFMNPAALRAACATDFADTRMLLAWEEGAGTRKLAGVWALRLRKIAPFWPMVLEGLPYDYAFLSSPVVDPGYVNEVIPAFFAAIEKSPMLPDVVSLHSLDAECPSYPAMLRELAIRGVTPLLLAEDARPFVTREFGVKRSGSTRKKLRQEWKRLTALGAVEVVNDRTPAGAEQAFEAFLALEQASWKGVKGTALLSDPRDAAFVRRLLQNLAAQGDASVALLRVDGEAIAAPGADVLRRYGLYLENRVQRDIRQVLARRAADRQDYRGAVCRFADPGDQLLRGGSKLHGPALGRTPDHGRYAGRCRPGKIVCLPVGSRSPARLPVLAELARPAPSPAFTSDAEETEPGDAPIRSRRAYITRVIYKFS
jgi:Acetyltransferase (GNAT) domain